MDNNNLLKKKINLKFKIKEITKKSKIKTNFLQLRSYIKFFKHSFKKFNK